MCSLRMKSQVAIVKCAGYDRAEVKLAVKKAVDLLGGIEKFVKPYSKLLLKPNLLMAIEPERAVTTHPEIVRAVVSILDELNTQVMLGDAPSVWGGESQNIEDVFEKTGMSQISNELNIKLVNFDNPRWRSSFPLTKYLDEVDALISLPKFKTHSFMVLTGAIKNLFGLIPGFYKTELHKKYFEAKDFAKVLVEVYKEARPVLTIVDGIWAMEAEGPATSGKARNLGLIFASSDAVALDSVLSIIMGLSPEAILTTRQAAREGLGISDINSIEILGESLSKIQIKPFILPSTSITDKIPKPLLNIVKGFIKFFPKINQKACSLCGACIKACPNKIMVLEFESIKIDYSKCISCFCCQEVCPNSAISVKKSILAKIIGL